MLSDPRVPNHHPIFPANLHQRAKTNTEGDCGGGTLCQHMDECCWGDILLGFFGALVLNERGPEERKKHYFNTEATIAMHAEVSTNETRVLVAVKYDML